MDKIDVNANGKKIRLSGSNAIIKKEKNIIENLELTGNECVDRLIIQKCIDDNKLKSSILYDGNTVYPFEKIVKAYRRLQKSGSLENLTKEMYHFFMYACGDIAHYDIGGYKCYYNFSFRDLENELLKNCWTSPRYSDIDKIFKELKIGKQYFKERDFIDIDNVSLNELKSIIKECRWEVNVKENNYLELSKDFNKNTTYSFDIDIQNYATSRIIREINYISNSFNKDNYIEDIVMKRENKQPTISEIVSIANDIKSSLIQFTSDVLYKTRIVAEEKESILNKENGSVCFEYEYEEG